jgi:hypothetical protein
VTRDCIIGLNYWLKLPLVNNFEGLIDLDFILSRPDEKPF